MNEMKNDILIGTVGTATTFGLGFFNVVLGCIAGILTVSILLLKLRREWQHRNDPPTEK
jgi:Na+/proline symporter